MTEDRLVRTVEERHREGEVWTRYGDHLVLMLGETSVLPPLPHIAHSQEVEVRAVRVRSRLWCLEQLLLQLEDRWTASYLVAAVQVRDWCLMFPTEILLLTNYRLSTVSLNISSVQWSSPVLSSASPSPW